MAPVLTPRCPSAWICWSGHSCNWPDAAGAGPASETAPGCDQLPRRAMELGQARPGPVGVAEWSSHGIDGL